MERATQQFGRTLSWLRGGVRREAERRRNEIRNRDSGERLGPTLAAFAATNRPFFKSSSREMTLASSVSTKRIPSVSGIPRLLPPPSPKTTRNECFFEELATQIASGLADAHSVAVAFWPRRNHCPRAIYSRPATNFHYFRRSLSNPTSAAHLLLYRPILFGHKAVGASRIDATFSAVDYLKIADV